MRRPIPELVVKELPHPAEDLSTDDDLLSWILVDQLGCLPNTKLGVHPQEVKFVGPTFKTDEVLSIVKETVTKGHIQQAMQRLQEFHLIKNHLATKDFESQKDRFIQHLRRYLLLYSPTSRLEIHLTSRYSAVTGHTELAVFATRCMEPGVVLQELQGSVVPLPEKWRQEMEIGEGFAVEPEGEEGDTDVEDDMESVTESQIANLARRDKGKGKDTEPRRRSDRTKRRDFSIVWSSLKRCFQLFLGPARFLNHDCNPNVELLRQGKYVTFRIIRPVRIGDELTTFYGESYFGKNNIECLCLSCEQAGKGGFTPKEESHSREPSASVAPSVTSNPGTPSRPKQKPPSSLRKVHSADDRAELGTPTKSTGKEIESQSLVSDQATTTSHPEDVDMEIAGSEVDTADPDSPPRRERYIREATRNLKPWSFSKRPPKPTPPPVVEDDEDDEPEAFVRCATCCVPLFERVWYNGRYFDHCQRCIRHALIFELPWPAHRPLDVTEYPAHWLFPASYIPRRISSYDLPTLNKAPRKKAIEPEVIEVSLASETKAEQRARRLRTEIEREEYVVGQLREIAWSRQEIVEQAREEAEAIIARKQAKMEEERARKAEEKRMKSANRIKGSGVWQFYEYVSPEVLRQRIEDRYKVTSGTRRGGKFRNSKEEEEMKRLAEEEARKQAGAIKKDNGLISPTNSLRCNALGGHEGSSPLRSEQKRGEGSGGITRVRTPKPLSIDDDDVIIVDESPSHPRIKNSQLPHPHHVVEPKSLTKISSPSRPTKRRKTSHTLTPIAPSSSTSSSTNGSETKRGRGRPKGTGHLQRAAAAKHAKSLVEDRPISEGSRSSPSAKVVDSLELGIGVGGGRQTTARSTIDTKDDSRLGGDSVHPHNPVHNHSQTHIYKSLTGNLPPSRSRSDATPTATVSSTATANTSRKFQISPSGDVPSVDEVPPPVYMDLDGDVVDIEAQFSNGSWNSAQMLLDSLQEEAGAIKSVPRNGTSKADGVVSGVSIADGLRIGNRTTIESRNQKGKGKGKGTSTDPVTIDDREEEERKSLNSITSPSFTLPRSKITKSASSSPFAKQLGPTLGGFAAYSTLPLHLQWRSGLPIATSSLTTSDRQGQSQGGRFDTGLTGWSNLS